MLETIGTFFGKYFGKQFFLQYFLTKGLDKLGSIKGKKETKAGLQELFAETYKCLCHKNGWEYDINEVNDLLQKKSISIDKMNDMDYVNDFLCDLLGRDYQKYYNIDLATQWYTCLYECIILPKFDKLYKSFKLNKLHNLENSMNMKLGQEEWETRENKEREHRSQRAAEEEFEQKIEFEMALEALESEEYEEAIKGFKKVSVWNKDEKIKYLCHYNEAYCYGKLAYDAEGYQKAIRFFQKAEKYADAARDDVVLLYRNIALLYTYLGEERNKVCNYKKANEYFEKILECAKPEDRYYVVDVILHLARNYMDMCDEVAMDEVKENLSLAMVLMMDLYLLEGDGLSEEQAFVLLHNMGRCFYHFAEKENMPEFMEPARELYLEVLKMDFVQQDKKNLAMVNENLAMTYHYDFSEEEQNLEKALNYYQIALELCRGLDKVSDNDLMKKQLNIAEVYARLYQLTENTEYFEQAEKMLYEMMKQVDVMPYNSLYFRINLSLMKLYCNQVIHTEEEIEREKWIEQAEKISNRIECLVTMTNYEKYRYTYFILKSRLFIFQIDTETDVNTIMNYKDELQEIAEKTKEGNSYLYEVVVEMVDDYEKIIQWRLNNS